MYDLNTEGFQDIKRFVDIERVSREPLSGVLDKSNLVFRTAYSPILTSGSITIYQGSYEVPSASYSVDYDSGTIVLDEPPNEQLRATYDVCEYTNMRLRRILMNGFYDMEALLTRNYRLSSGSTTYAAATESSDHLYIVDASAVQDPVTGSYTFSTASIQRGFYVACVEAALWFYRLDIAAKGFMWREDRGITVDKSRMAAGRATAMEFVLERRKRYCDAASLQQYGTAVYGGWIGNPVTYEYVYDHEWQQQSIDLDYRSLRGSM